MSEREYTLAMPNRRGQIAVRPDCPAPGKEAAVVPLLFGARITVGDADDDFGWSECWDYDDLEAANEALHRWDPTKEAEPSGWVRHIPSYRRRPDGDPRREYVAP